MKYLIQSFEKKQTKTGKDYIRATLKDEVSETEIQNVSIWSDFPNFEAITGFDTMVEGEIVEKDGFKNLKGPYTPKARGNFGGLMEESKKNKLEVQETISRNVALAQDRSALMWAKNNATDLVVNSDKTRNLPITEQFKLIEEYTAKLYAMELVTPF